MHAIDRVADGHGGEGVAVVAVFETEQFVFIRLLTADPILHGHFDGDFHGDGTGIDQKDFFQPVRCQFDQAFGELDGGFVGEAAEHDVRHGVDLLVHGLLDFRVVVTVHGGPPGAHAVDQFGAVRQGDDCPLGFGDADGWNAGGHFGVRMPDVVLVEIQECWPVRHKCPVRLWVKIAIGQTGIIQIPPLEIELCTNIEIDQAWQPASPKP